PITTLSLHDALPIYYRPARGKCGSNRERADVWGGAWRRSARRWELLAPLIASATGWRVWNPGRYGEPWHALFRGVYPLGVRPLLDRKSTRLNSSHVS